MAKNSLLTATTTSEILKIVRGIDFEQVRKLHKLGESFACKIESRTGAHYYRIRYSTQKPKRSLFTIECNEKRWRVKANLYLLSQYTELASRCSAKVKESITRTRTCTKCNSKCIGGAHFILDGHAYFTCIGSGHFFENLSSQEWDEFASLVKLENGFLLTSV